jgi:hypothetical protein
MSHLSEFLKDKTAKASHEEITGEEAAKIISSSSYESYEAVGFDAVEAKCLGIEAGKVVSVTPNDTGSSKCSATLKRAYFTFHRQSASHTWKGCGAEPGRGCDQGQRLCERDTVSFP